MQPNGSTHKVQHWKHRQRHRDKKKRAIQQDNLSPARKIADPYGIVQDQKQSGKPKPDTPELNRLPAHQKRDRKQVGDPAALLHALYPVRNRLPLFRLPGRRENGINNIDQHGQRKHRKSDP